MALDFKSTLKLGSGSGLGLGLGNGHAYAAAAVGTSVVGIVLTVTAGVLIVAGLVGLARRKKAAAKTT